MKKIRFLIREESGAISLMTVIMLVAFVGILGVVIDLGHLHTVQNELRNAADAAALAGARRLMPMTAPVGALAEPPWPMEDPPPCADARQAAADTALLNQTQGGTTRTGITLVPEEILTGVWDFVPIGTKAGTFTPVACDMGLGTNAVQVTARMDADLSQGSVIMTFAKIFGIDTVNPSATAVAAVGNLATLPKNSPGGFLAADNDFLKKAEEYYKANSDQTFYLILGPAGGQSSWEYADNGSWSLPTDSYSGGMNQTVQDYINNGTQQDISVGNSVDLNNGTLANVLQTLQNAVPMEMAMVGVYGDNHIGGDAWNQSTEVNNFWQVELTQVWLPGDLSSGALKNDPESAAIINAMYPDLNDQKNIVGMIAFKMLGPAGTPGSSGATPSNMFSLLPKLVQ